MSITLEKNYWKNNFFYDIIILGDSMETAKAYIDGEEIEVVVKLDDDELLDDTSIKEDSEKLEDTMDLTDTLSKTVEIFKNADEWNKWFSSILC